MSGRVFHGTTDEALASAYALLAARDQHLPFETMIRDMGRKELQDALLAMTILAGRYHELCCLAIDRTPSESIADQAIANALHPLNHPSTQSPPPEGGTQP